MLRGFLRRRVEKEKRRREELVRLASEFKELTIILFGSRARGDHTAASDFDLLVVYDDVDALNEFKEKLRKSGIPADVKAYRLEEALALMSSSTVILDALAEGLVLQRGKFLERLREEFRRAGCRKVRGGWILRKDGDS